MSNIFQDIANDAETVEQDLLGPDYKYYKKIKAPGQMGMSSDGSIGTLVDDISGLIAYVELLVTGNCSGGKCASTVDGPLGDNFFLKTGAKCKDVKTGNEETRYLYINNKPTGRIPFISEAVGMDFTTFEGILPGVLENLDEINPFGVFKGFLEGSMPDCQELKMETTPTSQNSNKTEQTEFITVSDIKGMDPCLFTLNDKTNPVTGDKCNEGFQNLKNMNRNPRNDPLFHIYILALSCLMLYIIYKLVKKVN